MTRHLFVLKPIKLNLRIIITTIEKRFLFTIADIATISKLNIYFCFYLKSNAKICFHTFMVAEILIEF